MASDIKADPLAMIDTSTVLSLLATIVILSSAFVTSMFALEPSTSDKTRFLFVWHAFDALIHFMFEGSYLYSCFFTYVDTTVTKGLGHNSTGVSEFLAPGVFFLNKPDRLYGALYGTSPVNALWQEYAKADKRWGGTDLTVISLELLTVLVMGPIAVWICVCLSRRKPGSKGGSEWFWMVLLATSELYGGFMTFAPEWLSGSPNLDCSNFLFLWVYLFFFNTLWVWIPLWILYEAYNVITTSLAESTSYLEAKKSQ
ncbi:hypothetical protein CAC42_7291 [Sphaceloma murrayae]|uniref:EXPERA domain-containing protein n=1 Tax=Sphaceloma murrayae TaxID=2082308 RepID=A0A2K1QWL5_9PEZI|nr:hypothetical protein CAC42_7291 [Sphaceloma murrayae]